MPPASLPIHAVLPDLLAALREHPSAVLIAPPGAGDRASLSIEVCRRADQAISDDTLNAALTKIEQGSYMKRKLKISEQCDRQSGK